MGVGGSPVPNFLDLANSYLLVKNKSGLSFSRRAFLYSTVTHLLLPRHKPHADLKWSYLIILICNQYPVTDWIVNLSDPNLDPPSPSPYYSSSRTSLSSALVPWWPAHHLAQWIMEAIPLVSIWDPLSNSCKNRMAWNIQCFSTQGQSVPSTYDEQEVRDRDEEHQGMLSLFCSSLYSFRHWNW